MIERKWKPENHKLEDAFFPVELCDLKFVYPAETDLFGKVVRTKDVLAKGHKAVVDINKCHVFATVTDKYKLVTNEDAYKWAEPVVGAVFNHSQSKDFDCFNVRMTGTRSSCCIDLIRKLDGGNVVARISPWNKLHHADYVEYFIYQYYLSCSEVQIATLPADQQEPARKEWEKVLRPFKRREPWL